MFFVNPFQSVRTKNQNQTKIYCENGSLLQNSWLCFIPGHKSLFYSVELQAWEVNIPTVLTRKQLNFDLSVSGMTLYHIVLYIGVQ